MYVIEFAPDGKNFQAIKTNTKIEKLYDYFTQNTDIAMQKALNPFAKFRLRNRLDNKIIGEK